MNRYGGSPSFIESANWVNLAGCPLLGNADVSDLGRPFPDDYTIAELHAIATRALANGDDYARALLRKQLEEEEFGEASDIAPGSE